jgi:hypothetical protein
MESNRKLHRAEIRGQMPSCPGDLIYQKLPDLSAKGGNIILADRAQIRIILYFTQQIQIRNLSLAADGDPGAGSD